VADHENVWRHHHIWRNQLMAVLNEHRLVRWCIRCGAVESVTPYVGNPLLAARP